MNQQQSIAIVTGAGSGLGRACATALVDRGMSVCLVARHGDRLKEVGQELESHGGHVLTIEADVASPDDVSRIARYLSENHVTVESLYNIAGTGFFGPLEKYSPSEIEEIMKGNLLGVVYLTQKFAPQLIENSGLLCTVMSTAANIGRANESVYCAAKWGAKGFMESLKAELKGQPIRIMSVYPGGMDSPFWEESRSHVPDSSNFMDPSDVAGIIVRSAMDSPGCQISDLTINRI